MILQSFLRALGQIGDPRFRSVMLRGLLWSLALLAGTYLAFLFALQSFTPDTLVIPFVGEVTGMHQLLGWASLLLMIGLSVFLMVPVAALFSGLFLDDVAAAVEDRHYAFLPPAPPQGKGAQLKETLNLLGLIIGVNALGLALVPVTGPLYIPVFWILNGFLLGREYFSLAALRRLPRDRMKALRQQNFWRIWVAGTLMAAPLSIPLLNLAIPVIGAATFTHLYHRMAASGR